MMAHCRLLECIIIDWIWTFGGKSLDSQGEVQFFRVLLVISVQCTWMDGH